jgi:two-component system response regulator DesR
MADPDDIVPVRKRVLIADDNKSMRDVIRSFVERQPGLEVCAATENGTETVDTALALRPDLLILDVQMPGLNGLEVAGILKKELPNAKTVLFTLHPDMVGKALASAVDANSILSKVDGLEGLAQAIEALVGNRAKVVDECLERAVRGKQIDAASLEKLAERLAAPLTRCDRNLKYMWVNRHYARWLKRPMEEFAGRRILDVIGKQAFDTFRPRFDEVLSGTHVQYEADADYDLIGQRQISAIYKPTIDGDGVADGWIAFVEDISERKSDVATS